jgi:hypothetical protein
MSSARTLLDELALLLSRDLEALRREIAAYPDDATPWQALPGLTNCGGTLVLHMTGNLRYFVGAVLGQSGYVRDREREFTLRDVSRADLDAEVAATVREVRHALSTCDPAVLDAPFPVAVGGQAPGTRLFLLHLAVHLTYHLGQVDAHRRAVTGDATTVETLSLAAIRA